MKYAILLLAFISCGDKTEPIECDYSHLIVIDDLNYCIDSVGLDRVDGEAVGSTWEFKTYKETVINYGTIKLQDTTETARSIIRYIY